MSLVLPACSANCARSCMKNRDLLSPPFSLVCIASSLLPVADRACYDVHETTWLVSAAPSTGKVSWVTAL